MTTPDEEAVRRALRALADRHSIEPGDFSEVQRMAAGIRERRSRLRTRSVIGGLVLAVLLAVGVPLGFRGGQRSVRVTPEGSPTPPVPSPQVSATSSPSSTTSPTPTPTRASWPSAVAPAIASLANPGGLAVAADGTLLIANTGSNQVLRRLASGALQVLAGTGKAGYSGDGGPAAAATLSGPMGIAVAPNGTIYVADTGNLRIRAISPQGTITTVAGDGESGSSGNGGPATSAKFTSLVAVAVAASGDLYVADDVRVAKVSAQGMISTFIQGGPTGVKITVGGSTAGLFSMDAVRVDRSGNVFVADGSPKALVEFSPSAQVLHVWENYIGATGLAAAPDGSIVAGDFGNWAVDRVMGGTLSEVVSFLHMQSPISGFRPQGVAVDQSGEIYVDNGGGGGGRNTSALVVVDPSGQVHVIAEQQPRPTSTASPSAAVGTAPNPVAQPFDQCPSPLPLPFDSAARENAIATARQAVPLLYSTLNTSGYQVTAADPATNGGFGSIAGARCGLLIQQRTYVVQLYFPAELPSASLSQGQLFVSRLQGGWQVWFQYH